MTELRRSYLFRDFTSVKSRYKQTVSRELLNSYRLKFNWHTPHEDATLGHRDKRIVYCKQAWMSFCAHTSIADFLCMRSEI